MGEEEASSSATHVVLVSFPAQGHINPLLRLANRLAHLGLLVTFTSTHDIGSRISHSDQPTPIGRGHLRFEFFSDGWPADSPLRTNLDLLCAQLSSVASLNFKSLLQNQTNPVRCVINNPFVPWAIDVAHDLNIPSAVLWVQSCAVYSTYYSYFHKLTEFPRDVGSEVTLRLPGLPELKAEDLPSFLMESNPYGSLTDVILGQFANIGKARWVLVNTFEELEKDVIRALEGVSPVVPVGPLVELDKSGVKGDLLKAADCIEWLDTQSPNSVIYVSVGSVVILTESETAEIAYGLQNSNRPFLWVVRNDCRHLLPKDFNPSPNGLIVPWSPQDAVLAHKSVSCFVTHCGWNSTLELLTAGVPVVAYPQWGDQLTDAKFLVDVYGVGVRLRAPVERGNLVKCVEEVSEGEEIRKKCLEWKEAAETAVREGGSSYRNIQAFVEDIMKPYVVSGGQLS